MFKDVFDRLTHCNQENQSVITIDSKEEMTDKIVMLNTILKGGSYFLNLQIKLDEFRQIIITDFKERYVRVVRTLVVYAFTEKSIDQQCISSHDR